MVNNEMDKIYFKSLLNEQNYSIQEEEDKETCKKTDGEEGNLYLRVDESDFSSDEVK